MAAWRMGAIVAREGELHLSLARGYQASSPLYVPPGRCSIVRATMGFRVSFRSAEVAGEISSTALEITVHLAHDRTYSDVITGLRSVTLLTG